MKFGPTQRIKFKALHGAYSCVTTREYEDSQITATDFEAEILINYFGKTNIQEGNVRSNPEKARQTFKLYPDGEQIQLNLVFPKPGKPELRLYISEKANFKPAANSVWFMYVRGEDLWIGAMEERAWRTENQILVYDEEDGAYQDSLQELDQIKLQKLVERDVYVRDRKIALERMDEASYQCEFNNSHNLFISSSSGKPYLEAHHLVPMSLQKTFSQPLDVKENIFCLCPNCHRAIHHAEKPLVRNMIDKLISVEPNVLKILNNDAPDIHRFYAAEIID